jgi:hypothetical protein
MCSCTPSRCAASFAVLDWVAALGLVGSNGTPPIPVYDPYGPGDEFIDD